MIASFRVDWILQITVTVNIQLVEQGDVALTIKHSWTTLLNNFFV